MDWDVRVEAGRFLAGRKDVESLVVGVSTEKSSSSRDTANDRPVYLKDVAQVVDGPGEVVSYVRFSAGPAWTHPKEPGAAGQWVGGGTSGPRAAPVSQPAVTIAVAKQKGANNVRVAQDVLARMDEIRKEVVPDDVSVAITRNYGITANDKVNELVEGLAVGIIVVIALLTMGLGFTESLVVAVAVPCVFGLTLAVNFLFGFSINRVTLFALTVSLGLLVDDPIVDVENIHRHFEMTGQATREIVLDAVNEVRPPLIAATLAAPDEKSPLQIVLWMPRAQRSSTFDLSRVYVKGVRGNMAPIAELGRWQETVEDKTIFHRNIEPVVYVTAEMAGRPPVETIMDIRADERAPEQMSPAGPGVSGAEGRPLDGRTLKNKGGRIFWAVPGPIRIRWWDEGEMRLTVHIFRDLGVGFLGALLGIYILLVYQTGSFGLPLVIMLAIPLMVIGVMPGYWLLNHVGVRVVGPYLNPMFFSSPAMIGMIALSGIVTRNSIIIIDFIHLSLARGKTLIQAIVESCAVRLRSILLTSGAAMLGAFPITLDTVFAGLAWSLIFGLFASTLFSLFVIPVAYNLIYAGKPGHGLPENMGHDE